MLTTSPVLTNSAGASPTNFRHAHAHAHAHHPHFNAHAYAPAGDSTTAASAAAAGAGPIPRRPSSRSAFSTSASASMKSTAPPRSRRNDAQADVVFPPKNRQTGQTAQATPPEAPPVPRPQPMAKTACATATPATRPQPSLAGPDSQAQAQAVLSPNKRRGSPEQPVVQDVSAADTEPSEQQSPKATKRAKAEESPPKILPQQYEFCEPVDMVELIAHMLSELITTNDAIRISNGGLTRFHSRTAPGISVRDYLHRLAKHATLTPPLLLAMVYYIDRLCLMYQDFTINTLTVHRFLITSATVAAKGLSDSFWNNATYARVGGVRLAELKLLELEFLHRVDWKIVPNPEVLVAYYRGLVERTPGYTLESDSSSDEDLIDEDNEDQEDASN